MLADLNGRSPTVMRLAWGEMLIESLGTGRDFKLFPDGGRPWDWSETDTHHQPGIQVADVSELVTCGSEVVVLSRGFHSRLHTCPHVFEFLHSKGIAVYVAETKAAADVYNALAGSGCKVGGLFHSTC